MKKTIVFDFDKTLTFQDSLTVLFKNRMKGKYRVYIPLYFLLKILSKIRVVSIKKEKEWMIKILFNSNWNIFIDYCKQTAENLELTPIANILNEKILNEDNVIVISATAEYILHYIFRTKPIVIIGTTFKVNNRKIKSITCHPFGKEKYKELIRRKITFIDEMYYDSISDENLIPLCHRWYKVKNGVIL